MDATSVSDPDPHGSALKRPVWIRIRIPVRDADSGSGSSSYKTTKQNKNIEFNLTNFVRLQQVYISYQFFGIKYR